MPVTYPIAFPSNLGMSGFKMGLRTAVGRLESPFSFTEQIVKFSGEIWEIEISLPNMLRADAELFSSFLLKLRGKYGSFLVGDPNGQVPQGAWTGTPLVKGAGQTGDQLIIDGLSNSTANIVKAGDYFQLGSGATSRLHKVLDDASTDGTGTTTLLIAPNLRAAPADNAVITKTGAKGVFRLVNNIDPVSINSNSIYGISFKAREVLG